MNYTPTPLAYWVAPPTHVLAFVQVNSSKRSEEPITLYESECYLTIKVREVGSQAKDQHKGPISVVH